ncbi:xanthine dehydrogenase family protein subunit M [Anoxybacterium hadale]|uniref:Xanthine dehydrogenase family protein subunit M n=1 Tax=Anoxybacterium hadale TaxID=3408580 RepID=A0ACD1A6U5_9FIRM|nr:xanthine dehydrogenase family protein subunit M [Clostridiales bacterium]
MSRTYFQPTALEEALQIRRDNSEASLLAGGTDLVVAMRHDRGPAGDLIDLSKIMELKGIHEISDSNHKAVGCIHETTNCVHEKAGSIRIGPMSTFTEIMESQLLREAAGILCEAAETVGSPQIRNRGTIGGNLCNASAAADCIPPLLCLNAAVELLSLGSDGSKCIRILPLEMFLLDSKKTDIRSDEILTGIFFQRSAGDMGFAFQKIGRRNALAIARLNGSCAIRLNGNTVTSLSFALGAATSKPERIESAEEYLKGRELTDEALTAAGKRAAEYVLEKTGVRASSSYKLPVIERFTASLIRAAAERKTEI